MDSREYKDQKEDIRNKVKPEAGDRAASEPVRGERRTGRHTWIGERNPDAVIDWSEDAPPSRGSRNTARGRALTDEEAGILAEKTRVVERQRKPYTGFITDEQIEENQRIFGLDSRRTRMVTREERAELYKTRVFDGSRIEPEEGSHKGGKTVKRRTRGTAGNKDRGRNDAGRPERSDYVSIRLGDDSRSGRLIALLVVFVLLIAAEAGYVLMRMSAAKMPAKAEAARAEAARLAEDNVKLGKEASGYGDYEEKKALLDSWKRLEEKLEAAAPQENAGSGDDAGNDDDI